MRALFCSTPALSHFNALANLALCMREAGHEVLCARSKSTLDRPRALGLEATPVGLDIAESGHDRYFPEIRGMEPSMRLPYMFQEVWGKAVARPAKEDVLRLISTWQPDVIIHEFADFGAAAAAVVAGVPRICHGAGPPSNVFLGPRFAARQLADLVRGDLQPDESNTWVQGNIYIDPFLPSLNVEPVTFAVPIWRARPSRSQMTSASAPDDIGQWLESRENPRIYATVGTIFNRTPALLESIYDVIAELGVTTILTVGDNRDPREIDLGIDFIRVERFVSHNETLPHCDAVVAHGGYGTTADAIASGLPMVLTPLGADQYLVAAGCQQTGAAVVVRPDAPPEEWEAAIRRVLSDGSYRRSAEVLRAELYSLPAVEEVALQIERFVAKRSGT